MNCLLGREAKMRIEFERTGGFTGIPLKLKVQVDALPVEEAQQLRCLVAEAHFFDLPPELASLAPAADQFQYQITVEDAGRTHSVRATETAVPASLWPLVRQLTTMARRMRTRPADDFQAGGGS
jgi:hypothetical protein